MSRSRGSEPPFRPEWMGLSLADRRRIGKVGYRQWLSEVIAAQLEKRDAEKRRTKRTGKSAVRHTPPEE